MSYKNPKIKIFLFIVLFLLSVSLILAIIYGKDASNNELSQNNTKNDSSKIVQEDATIHKLKNLNRDAVDNARNVVTGSVPGVTDADYYLGSLSSPVEMIIYCDFKSQLCSDYQETVKQVLREFGDQVLVVFRHFYLSNSNNSRSTALAMECAGEQGKFFEMGSLLLGDYLNNVKSDYLLDVAEEIGLNRQTFDDCLKSEKYSDKILSQLQDAEKAGVLGVPCTFINGEKLPGNYSFDDFRDSSGRDREGVKSVILRKLKK